MIAKNKKKPPFKPKMINSQTSIAIKSVRNFIKTEDSKKIETTKMVMLISNIEETRQTKKSIMNSGFNDSIGVSQINDNQILGKPTAMDKSYSSRDSDSDTESNSEDGGFAFDISRITDQPVKHQEDYSLARSRFPIGTYFYLFYISLLQIIIIILLFLFNFREVLILQIIHFFYLKLHINN